MTCKITCNYQTGCFCQFDGDLPKFPDGEPFSTEPRFNFRKEARTYADKHGLTIVEWNKYKSALATYPAPCQHRLVQFLRISWGLA